MASSSSMFKKPSAALMIGLRDFVLRHEIFVEACEFDDGLIFVRQRKGRTKGLGPRRHFSVFLRRSKRRVKFFTISCGSEDLAHASITIDFPEKTLLGAAEAAIEYETCGRDLKRYSRRFPKDTDFGRALFGYLRSESRLLTRLLDTALYEQLLQLIRRHRAPLRRRGSSRAPGRS